MATFRTIAKLWPSGTEIDLGDDTNNFTPPTPPATGMQTYSRVAAPIVTTDGTNQFQFLFWNTGRRLTAKRRVRWEFTRFGWSTWTATRWYGIPPTGPGGGPPRVRVDGLRLGSDTPFTDSPIDVPASTFPAGAHPFDGSDHQIGTAGGPVTVAALDPFHDLQFAGWLRLVFQGDPTGEFVETDEGPGGTSTFGVFEHVVGETVDVAQNQSADFVAAYGNSTRGGGGGFGGGFRIPEWWVKIWPELERGGGIKPPLEGDPGPWDLIRIRLLQDILRETKPVENVGGGGLDLQRLIEAAPKMSPEELQRSLKEIDTTVGLANTAKRLIEGKLKK